MTTTEKLFVVDSFVERGPANRYALPKPNRFGAYWPKSGCGPTRCFPSGGEIHMRPISRVAPDWWDYTTLDPAILDDAARLSAEDLLGLARDGFDVRFYDTLEEFYLAEALEYITAWRQATADNAGRHLRPDRPDRAIAARGPAGQRA